MSQVLTISMRCPRELLQAGRHRRVRLIAALLAFVPLTLVLADARPPALLAVAPSALVLADARARTPCIGSFGAGAGRCPRPRTPFICFFGDGAGRCPRPRTPCICPFGDGAGRHCSASPLRRLLPLRLPPPVSGDLRVPSPMA